jgi:hypothetical protein
VHRDLSLVKTLYALVLAVIRLLIERAIDREKSISLFFIEANVLQREFSSSGLVEGLTGRNKAP